MEGISKLIRGLALFFVAVVTGIWCCAFFMPILALLAVVAFLSGPIAIGVWICGLILGEDWNLFTFTKNKK